MAEETFEMYRDIPNTAVAITCARPDGDPVDPKLWLPAPPIPPAPTPVTTAGHPGCVTGDTRPVADTALTGARATADTGDPLIYEYQRLGDSESISTSGSEGLDFDAGDLAPGETYRWRARVDDHADQLPRQGLFRPLDDEELGWSPWCEFAVAADAVDYRELGDVSLEALTELGVRPDRSYEINLSHRQQRLLREGTDVGEAGGRMTLTGPRWTDLLMQLADSAYITASVSWSPSPPC
jgi:hypothetical protein